MITRKEIEQAAQMSEAEIYRIIGANAYVYEGEVLLKKSLPNWGDDDELKPKGRHFFKYLLPDTRSERQRLSNDRCGSHLTEAPIAIARRATV